MHRVLTAVPFEAQPNHLYVYDDNTGMVFPSTPATVDLLKAHCDVPLDAAAASLTDRHSASELADAASFIDRWETRFGAFYRNAEYREQVEKQMLDFSRAEMEALIAEHAWVQFVMVITEDCNLRCSYCYYSDAYPLSRNRTKQQLSFETGRKGLDRKSTRLNS